MRTEFDQSVSGLERLKGGEASAAFGFRAGGEAYVMRVNTNSWSFEKDRYAFTHFGSDELLIPEVLRVGSMDDALYFAVSRRGSGRHLMDLTADEQNRASAPLLEVMDAIRHVDVRAQGRYGEWDVAGKARCGSWKETLLAIENDSWEGMSWRALFETTMMEPEAHETLFRRMSELVDHCPEDIHFVHGDFGFDNLLWDGERITSVFDWGGSMYGDFLYDAAWLAFWSDRYDVDAFRAHFDGQGTAVPRFSERMLCYRLHVGLGALGFYAWSQQERKYRWARDRAWAILGGDVQTDRGAQEEL